MSLVHEIEKLLLADLGADGVPHLALAHPSPLEHQTYGQLGVLLTLSGPESLRHEVAVSVAETLNDRYYHGNELNAEAAFESALAEVNRKLHTLLSEGVTGWLPTFSAAVFAARGDQLILSVVGTVVAQLFRGSRIQDVASTPGADRSINPLKIFSSVIVGRVAAGDAVLLATPSLLDYYSLEKLKRLITVEAPGESLAAIERHLAAEVKRHAFAAFLVSVREAPTGEPAPAAAPLPQPVTSMERLIHQERRTASFLSPSFLATLGSYLTRGSQWLGNAFRQLVLRKPPRRPLPRGAEREPITPRIVRGRDSRTGWMAATLRVFVSIGRGIGRGVQAGVRLVRRVEPPNPVMVRDHLANLPRRTERRTNRYLRRFLEWPRSQQVLAVAAIVLLVIFAQSVVSLGSARAQRLSKDEQQSLVTQARQKVDEATATLTYGDERSAAKLLAEAAAALGRLPKKPRVSGADLAKVRRDLAAALDQTQHRRRVGQPVVLTDLAGVSGTAPTFLLAFADLATAGEIGSGRLAAFDRTTQKLSVLDANVPDSGAWNHATPEAAAAALLYTDRNSLVRFTATGRSFTPLPLDLPSGADVHGVATFEGKLYLLDVGGNRILRLTRSGAGYGGAANWLQDPTANLRGAADIAVDGSVYVLGTDGTLAVFFQGKPQALTLDPLDPPLTAPARLVTSATLKNLYILDPPHHRLVVYDKQGGLKEQILLPDDVPLSDVTVSEKDKEALLLSDKKILRVDLNI